MRMNRWTSSGDFAQVMAENPRYGNPTNIYEKMAEATGNAAMARSSQPDEGLKCCGNAPMDTQEAGWNL